MLFIKMLSVNNRLISYGDISFMMSVQHKVNFADLLLYITLPGEVE